MNPTLTPEEKERLEQNAAAMLAHVAGKPVQFRHLPNQEWFNVQIRDNRWYFENGNYRPAPTRVTRNWNCMWDVPAPVCWVRRKSDLSTVRLIIGIDSTGIYDSGHGFESWSQLERCEHSTDRKTWAPCSVEEDGK